MSEKYIVFDVETPNSANDRMSAIGLAVVEGDRIVEEFSTLINPEVYFNRFNIQLTGISPEDVVDAPTFSDLWPSLKCMLEGGILIAHHAPFDMSVLAKCLDAYGIFWKEFAAYACTCQMGRRCYPDLPNHRLNTLCEHLKIELDHHRAGSDSRACAQLLLHYQAHPPKGEFVLMITVAQKQESKAPDTQRIMDLMQQYKEEGLRHKQAAEQAALQMGISKKTAYEIGLKIFHR